MNLRLDKSAWKRVTLGEVVRHVTDRVDVETSRLERFLAGEHIPSRSLAITDWGIIGRDPIGPMFYKRFQPGHVLYVSRRTYLRKVAVPDFEGITGEKTFVLESVDRDVLLQEFLPFVLSAEPFHSYAIRNSRGSVNPYLNWGELAAYKFNLPPRDVQKRLSGLLWVVERHRLAVDEVASLVDAAADVHLTGLWKQDRDKRTIGDIGECVTGSTPSKSNKTFWNSEDVPFYTPSEISSDTMRPAHQRVSRVGAAVGRLLPEHAVAVACIGGDMGKSAVIVEPGISNQQITSIVGLQKDDAYALQSLLAHPFGRAAMEARETTTIVRKLNKSDLMKIQIPWPADRMALRKLVSARRAAHEVLSADLASLADLRSSMLADIFGEADASVQ